MSLVIHPSTEREEMLPQKLTTDDPESVRLRFKVVNLSTGADVGPKGSWILSADVETGCARLTCKMPDDKVEQKDFNLGPRGIAIVIR